MMKDYVIIDGIKINDDDLTFLDVPFLDGTKEFGSENLEKQILDNIEEKGSTSSNLSLKSFKKENKQNVINDNHINEYWYFINDENKKLFGLGSKELNMFIDLEPVKTQKDFVSLLKNLKETPNIHFEKLIIVLQEVVVNFMGKSLKDILIDKDFVGDWQKTHKIIEEDDVKIKDNEEIFHFNHRN